MRSQNVLILDDEKGFRDEIGDFLSDEGFHVVSAGMPSEAVKLMETDKIDIGLFDVRLPERDGIDLLGEVKKKYPNMEIIVMTGFGDMATVIRAMRSGASDFLSKPFKLNEIKETIERVSKYQRIKSYHHLNDSTNQSPVEGLIGSSDAIKNVYKQLSQVAKADDATVLFTGESGTGKELMARILHSLSKRSGKTFLPVNCSTIPDELFENEFFGHTKGSFTDAKTDQVGIFEAADNGTLFLDEIGEMKYTIQAKLLRVIEDKSVSRIGTHKDKKINVRILAATNQDLQKMIENKTFRADLFHRLNILNIQMPPLREHKEDIPELFDHFTQFYIKKLDKEIKRIDRNILPALQKYNFPGNVRELKNMIERAVIMCDSEILTMDCFNNLDLLINENKYADSTIGNYLSLPAIEREAIVKALHRSKNNKSKAAKMLSISRQALDRKMQKYGIN
ncbi:MAG: sigma-54-dependent Fis family transcriptional regulator [Bacteroidales bacterium]|nr:sigma-54-dependent Fis family transcriptional regulator [Bacteroidales bacterium]